MRVVVVGGGVIGLLTAAECLRAGAQVRVVDQHEMPSPWAASYDRHRVVRALHRGNPALTRAAARADQAWQDVDRRLGGQLYHRVGAVTAMPSAQLRSELVMLADAGVPASWLAPDELAARYPRLRFPDGLAAVIEPAAGAVLADRALNALVQWLADHPAVELHPGRRVLAVDEVGGVRLDGGTVLEADRIVVAAGPWSSEGDLLPTALGGELTLYRQSMLSYAPAPSRFAWVGTPAVPAFGTANGAWLMPPVADTPARLSAASACRAVAEMTDRVTPDAMRAHLVDEFGALIADFDPVAVVEAKDAYYLGGPDGPLLANYGNVWAYAACGGMSFKFAPLIARALADRVAGRATRPTGLSWLDRPATLIEGRTR